MTIKNSENFDIRYVLEELEESNNATELLRFIADKMGFTDLEEKFEQISFIRILVGHLSEDLNKFREELRQELKERGCKHPDWELFRDFV